MNRDEREDARLRRAAAKARDAARARQTAAERSASLVAVTRDYTVVEIAGLLGARLVRDGRADLAARVMAAMVES